MNRLTRCSNFSKLVATGLTRPSALNGFTPKMMYFKRNHFGETQTSFSMPLTIFILIESLHSPRWSLQTRDQLVSGP